MKNPRILITFLFLSLSLFATPTSIDFKTGYNVTNTIFEPAFLEKADEFYMCHNYTQAIKNYQFALDNDETEKTPIFKKVALSYSALKKTDQSLAYLEKYLSNNFKPEVLQDSGFDPIRKTKKFNTIAERYIPSFDIATFLYMYIALIGFYIAVVIHFNQKIDVTAKKLISAFIFIHSFFIIHIFLYVTNYQFEFPHSYRMSTCFSFLYGPLLYFYFKRTTQDYSFSIKDVIHLLPTLLILIYLLPTYVLSADKKLQLMVEGAAGFNSKNSTGFITIVILKTVSLLTYGIFIRKIFLKSQRDKNFLNESKIWQKNIYRIHFSYLFFYCLYGFLTLNNITVGVFFNLQVFAMAFMILYIGYSANAQPMVFSGSLLPNKKNPFKYEKSGLTDSLSKELKENLIQLFDFEKIYKESNINLEMLAERLQTTRHNASQVINEHFNMSFHELINKHRIEEAKALLNKNLHKNLNIIDIAYEVGYNNKVTFNKAFKKDTRLTPSQYQKSSISSCCSTEDHKSRPQEISTFI